MAGDASRHPIYALWAHPRSRSTVFERVMIERGDMEVLHEPFSYVYYAHEGRRRLDDMVPDDDHPQSYGEIRDACLEAARSRPVFFKDMPYHALDHLLGDDAFLAAITHTFLIRDPLRSIPSHYAVDPEMTLEEVGLEAESRLYDAVAAGGATPVVVDAADLRTSSAATVRAYCETVGLAFRAEALQWQKSSQPQWGVWEKWHGEVAQSEGIETERRRYEVRVDNDDRLRAFYDHHRPFYERLYRQRLKPPATAHAPGGP